MLGLRPSARLLAQHARTPSIHFPDRSKKPESHAPVPHPCAPDSIVSSSSFLSSLGSKPKGTGSHSGYGESSGTSSSSSTPETPLAGPAGGQAQGSGFESSLPSASYDESNLPAWLSRSRYAPQEQELEAVLSGGASEVPLVTNKTRELWYNAQI